MTAVANDVHQIVKTVAHVYASERGVFNYGEGLGERIVRGVVAGSGRRVEKPYE